MKNIKRSMTSKCSIEFNNTNYIKNMLRNINSNRNTTFISLSIFKIIIFLTNSNSLFTIFSNFNFLLFLRLIRLRLNSFNTNNSIFLFILFWNNKSTFCLASSKLSAIVFFLGFCEIPVVTLSKFTITLISLRLILLSVAILFY